MITDIFDVIKNLNVMINDQLTCITTLSQNNPGLGFFFRFHTIKMAVNYHEDLSLTPIDLTIEKELIKQNLNLLGNNN